jgi:signal transduction histidine kinase
MAFRIQARTILQLGAELISSDGIAFYELIKNAVDAKSPRVDVRLRCPVPFLEYQRGMKLIEEAVPEKKETASATTRKFEALKEQLQFIANEAGLKSVDFDTCQTLEEVRSLLEDQNYATISDTGHGMSLEDLSEIFLTVGTRSRQRMRGAPLAPGDRPFLGEKGIGRLSSMRLGERLEVLSTKSGESRWNRLSIDWRAFSHDSDTLLEEVEVAPERGKRKDSNVLSGTIIRISALNSAWDEDKLRKIAVEDFSRLTDPFARASRFPVDVKFNDTSITIRSISRDLLDAAHARCKGEFKVDRVARTCEIVGKINYDLRNEERNFHYREVDIESFSGSLDLDVLLSLGSVKFEWYWYNRRILAAVDGVGDRRTVSRLVEQWGGGLMLYRDGFRVNPYGSSNDDWLLLDPSALASTGYKVNRKQIIGKVEISSSENPVLIDQTNREGLRDCSEKFALVEMLHTLLVTEFRGFLNRVDKAIYEKEQLDFEILEERLATQEDSLDRAIARLLREHQGESELVLPIRRGVDQIRKIVFQAKEIASVYEDRQSQLFNLAGIGLITEIVAHELNRATIHTLSLTKDLRVGANSRQESILKSLEQQLKTLQKRLRSIDPVSTAGRQHKEEFDVIDWIRTICQSHEAQFRRHNIAFSMTVSPRNGELTIRAVRGMFVQVLENLISNSIYWLGIYGKKKTDYQPAIDVHVDVRSRTISFSDNGPGIEAYRADDIFQPFVTTKPARKGKGLGLYIAREIAKYSGAKLELGEEHTHHEDALNTFILTLGE